MNVLVTGANGLLGRNLVNILSVKHTVFAIIRNKSKVNFLLNDNVKIIEIDLLDFSEDILPVNIDAIYYLAQSSHFRDFPNSYNDIFSINVQTPLRFADWGRKNNVKQFFYTSSGGVYKHPVEPVKEIFDINANDKNGFYLDSKLSAEVLLRNFACFFKTFVILRPFFVYGPGQNSSMLIPRLIHNIIEKSEITLSCENGIKINPIFVSDAVRSMERLLDLEGEYIFNVAGSEVVSLRELSAMIAQIVNEPPKYKVLDSPQSDLIADISKMKENLHMPKVTLEDGLKSVYEDIEK